MRRIREKLDARRALVCMFDISCILDVDNDADMCICGTYRSYMYMKISIYNYIDTFAQQIRYSVRTDTH